MPKEPFRLWVFSDTSQETFLACAKSWQRISDGKCQIRPIAVKSRVTSLKQLSIPRLVSQAAVFVSRIGKIKQEESRIKFKAVKFFSDSTIALAWLQSSSPIFKPLIVLSGRSSNPHPWWTECDQWYFKGDICERPEMHFFAFWKLAEKYFLVGMNSLGMKRY